jgi:hypothetical protein
MEAKAKEWTQSEREEFVGACPDCGAEPGCNIDCNTCLHWHDDGVILAPEGP